MRAHLRNDGRSVRRLRRLTVAELAARAGSSRQSVGAIEAGRTIPAIDVALRIARVLETPVERLFDGEREAPTLDVEPAMPATRGRVLAVATAAISSPPIERLLDALTSRGFRQELASLGYDVRKTGERVAVVRAA